MITQFVSWGVTRMFRGLREGRPGLAGVGAAVAMIAWLRGRRPPARERIYGTNLSEGETIKIRFLRGETVVDETEVVG